MDPVRKLLKDTFGVEITENNFSEQLAIYLEAQNKAALSKQQTEMDSVSAKLTEAATKLAALEVTLKELEPKAALGTKYLDDERKEAVRLYRLAKGEQISDAILKTLEKADLEIAQAFKQEFKKEAEVKFPTRCGRCGSTQVSRQSSQENSDAANRKEKSQTLHPETTKRLQDLHGV